MSSEITPRRSTLLDPYATRVDALMTRDITVARADMTLHEAATAMIDARVTGLPVVDDAGVPIGVLSLRDIVRAFEHPEARTAADSPTLYHGRLNVAELLMVPHFDAAKLVGTVRSHMSKHVLVCKQYHAVASAARSMADHGVHRLLVVHDGKLVGMLSALDIAAWVGQAGGQP